LLSSQRTNSVAVTPPISCAPIKSGTLLDESPAKLLVAGRASVTSGFANAATRTKSEMAWLELAVPLRQRIEIQPDHRHLPANSVWPTCRSVHPFPDRPRPRKHVSCRPPNADNLQDLSTRLRHQSVTAVVYPRGRNIHCAAPARCRASASRGSDV